MPEFVGIGDHEDALDPPLADGQGQDAEWLPIEVADNARVSVDFDYAVHALLGLEAVETVQSRAGNMGCTMDHIGHRGRLTAAIGAEHHISGEQRHQPVHVTAAGGLYKTLEQVVVLTRGRCKARPRRMDMLAGAPQDLPAVGFGAIESSGNLGVRVVEDFVQQKDGALGWRQPFQQHQERHGERFAGAQQPEGVDPRIGNQGLGQPLAYVLFAPYARGLQMVDRKAADNRDQKSLGGADVRGRGLLPADEGLLEQVFGIGHTSHHAVGDGEKETAILGERVQTAGIFDVHAVHLQNTPAVQSMRLNHGPGRRHPISMDLELKGKSALVTGSTAGIGLAIVAALAKEGAAVIVNGRTQERVDRAVKSSGAAHGIAADLGTEAGARAVIERFPAVDILVNNLGIFEPKPFDEITDGDWRRFFEVNVLSGVRMSRHYMGPMRQNNWGRIVFISSESALQIPKEMIHYGMTKTAQLAVSRGLAETSPGTAVTVNAVLPGPTKSEGVTEFVAKLASAQGVDSGTVEREFFRTGRPSSLLQRFATPEEVAAVVAFVCSPRAAAINGAAVRAEGGVVQSIA
jgi:NAD(P)-dependent dehydrogenase (short-subunit alcohol dehydrogenase family)